MRTPLTRLAVVGLSASLAACADGVAPETRVPPPTVLIEQPTTTWPGGRIVLRALHFALDSDAIVLVGGRAVPATLIDLARRSVTLPESAGSYVVSVVWATQDTVVAGTVTAVGSLIAWQSSAFPNSNYFPAALWPEGGTRLVMLGSGGWLSLDLRSPAVWDTLLSESSGFGSDLNRTCGYYPLAVAGMLTVGRCDGYLTAWRAVGDTLALVDSSLGGGLAAAFVGNGRWISYGDPELWTRSGQAAWTRLPRYWMLLGSLVLSPDGDRVVPGSGYGWTSNGSDPGSTIPVWNPATMEEVFTLPGPMVLMARFSADGDTIFMVTQTEGGRLLRFYSASAADGRILAPGDSLAVPQWSVSGVVSEPEGPWLYAIGNPATARPVTVIDRRTMRVVGALSATAGAVRVDGTLGTCGLGSCFGVVDGAARRLHVFEFGKQHLGQSNRVYSFSLLP